MMLFGKVAWQLCGLKKIPWSCDSRYFWGWLNAVFNKVDYERIRDVGPERAASEWLLRCGAMVRYHGQERWQKDYNHLPTGPLDKYKIQAIDATDSCIMGIGFDHMEGLQYVEKIRLCKCHYIEDACLERISQLENLQKSLLEMEIISCGNVTDKGIITLHHLRDQHEAWKTASGISLHSLPSGLPQLVSCLCFLNIGMVFKPNMFYLLGVID
ncbi:ATP synthase subunit s, mitochondrial isoform X2 [Molossus molossus]|uniref:ATP synthase subunit s, mitochondrial isoform X2 n=1 Tax=Molossus molossus TaxID=27622 RepID=UPI00174737F0|nr:ATP synthase subunit s, mitochondrial isoform X2 [Molossus molossus]